MRSMVWSTIKKITKYWYEYMKAWIYLIVCWSFILRYLKNVFYVWFLSFFWLRRIRIRIRKWIIFSRLRTKGIVWCWTLSCIHLLCTVPKIIWISAYKPSLLHHGWSRFNGMCLVFLGPKCVTKARHITVHPLQPCQHIITHHVESF